MVSATFRAAASLNAYKSFILGRHDEHIAHRFVIGHNLLLLGPPGTGKTMLARRLAGILPPPTRDEVIEISVIWSVVGLLIRRGTLVTRRPFRAPHHTISVSGLIGGGSPPHPGEVTLAHRGVLFMDELPRYGPRARPD